MMKGMVVTAAVWIVRPPEPTGLKSDRLAADWQLIADCS